MRGRDEREPEHGDEDEPQRRNDQSLLPRKLSGITSTIAIACETIFPQPSQSRKTSSQSWLTASAASATTKKRSPCWAKWPFWSENVQCLFHQ